MISTFEHEFTSVARRSTRAMWALPCAYRCGDSGASDAISSDAQCNLLGAGMS
jgi:hypothetical protein